MLPDYSRNPRVFLLLKDKRYTLHNLVSYTVMENLAELIFKNLYDHIKSSPFCQNATLPPWRVQNNVKDTISIFTTTVSIFEAAQQFRIVEQTPLEEL